MKIYESDSHTEKALLTWWQEKKKNERSPWLLGEELELDVGKLPQERSVTYLLTPNYMQG